MITGRLAAAATALYPGNHAFHPTHPRPAFRCVLQPRGAPTATSTGLPSRPRLLLACSAAGQRRHR